MINEEKIKIMSQMALYREVKGREVLKLAEFKDENKIVWAYLKTIPMGIIAYALIAGLLFAFFYDSAVEAFSFIGYFRAAAILAATLLVFLILYALYSEFMAKKKLRVGRGGLWIYSLNAMRLNNIQKNEKASQYPKRQ